MSEHEPVAGLSADALADLAARAYYGDHGVYPTYREHGDAEHWAAVGRSLAAHVERATAADRTTAQREQEVTDAFARGYDKATAEAEARLAAVRAELQAYRAEDLRDREWAAFERESNIRCLACDLRYAEREQYGCLVKTGHRYDAAMLDEARQLDPPTIPQAALDAAPSAPDPQEER
jgi:hypothetical protein